MIFSKCTKFCNYHHHLILHYFHNISKGICWLTYLKISGFAVCAKGISSRLDFCWFHSQSSHSLMKWWMTPSGLSTILVTPAENIYLFSSFLNKCFRMTHIYRDWPRLDHVSTAEPITLTKSVRCFVIGRACVTWIPQQPENGVTATQSTWSESGETWFPKGKLGLLLLLLLDREKWMLGRQYDRCAIHRKIVIRVMLLLSFRIPCSGNHRVLYSKYSQNICGLIILG